MILSKVCNKRATVRHNCTPVGVLVRDEACSDSDWVKALAAMEGFELLMKSARAAVAAMEEFEGLREEVEYEGCRACCRSRISPQVREQEKRENVWQRERRFLAEGQREREISLAEKECLEEGERVRENVWRRERE